jgi:serine/threonine-protein kinase HipA
MYLMEAGNNRFGALDFRADPQSPEPEIAHADLTELDQLLEAADHVQNGLPVPKHLLRLFDAGPSMGGARPKAVVIHQNRQHIAKFPAKDDPFNVPLIEQATLELARSCGLDVPATKIMQLSDRRSVMLIERFDRNPTQAGWARQHVVSALTLLGLHESESPTASYAGISDQLGLVAAAGHIGSDRRELFKRMVFNVLVSNDDDHLRNHALVWDPPGNGWYLSPLYDVLPKPQVGTERYLHVSVGAEGRLATLDNALTHAGRFGLMPPEAVSIIDGLATKVRAWREFFEVSGVPAVECDKVASAFRDPDDIGLKQVLARA